MLEINLAGETDKIISFIKNIFEKQGFKKAVIAVSGGVDSSTCLLLLTKALGSKNIFSLKLPYGNQDMRDADKIINLANIPSQNISTVNIKEIVQTIIAKLKTTAQKSKLKQYNNRTIEQLRLGNIMARTRMILLYDFAKTKKALVCGTENKSEYLLGYFTLFGDQAADFSPIQHIYKTQVRKLASYLAVPECIIKKAATAGLWQGQTDEQELGFTYEEADKILDLYFNKKLSLYSARTEVRYSKQQKMIEKVLQRVKDNLYKQQIPYIVKKLC